jgi:hypothetical protein
METDILSSVVDILSVTGLVVMAWLVFMLYMVRRLEQRINRELQQTAQEFENDRLIALTVEVAGDQYLCYNVKDMAFVCQGRDLAEIRERFRQRYPEKNAAIYNGDESAVKTLKSQLKELNENSSSIRHSS